MARIYHIAKLTVVAALSLTFLASTHSTGAAVQESATPAKSPADTAFDALAKDVHRLQQSLTNKGGIAADDHAIISAMRDRSIAFTKQFPTDPRGPKLELALSKWLKDDAAVERSFARVLELEPENDAIRLSWAKLLRTQNRFGEAVDVFRARPPDPVKAPNDLMLMADCLYAEHGFEESLALLESIPASAVGESRKAEMESRIKSLREIISAWGQEQMIRQKEEQANDLPRVMLVTPHGPITLELFENEAPNTVANFISLIEKGFYNTSKFHRVLPNFMAQGGDPNSKPGGTGTPGEGDPGYYIPDEHGLPDHRLHFAGSLSMAKTEADHSGGCQFFITVTPTPHLDGKHTVFGRVIEGLDAARRIKQDDVIELMTVIRKREHDYVPITLPKKEIRLTPEPVEIPPTTPTGEGTVPPIVPPPVVTPPPTDAPPATTPE